MNALTIYQPDTLTTFRPTYRTQGDYQSLYFEFMVGIMRSRRFTDEQIFAAFANHRSANGDSFFYQLDMIAAYQSLMDRCTNLPSDSRQYTNGKKPLNTRKAYSRDVSNFLIYLFERRALPTESLMMAYMGDLKQSGHKAVSITRAMAPVRTFCKTLAYQVAPDWMQPAEMLQFQEKQKGILRGIAVKNPRSETRDNRGKLFSVGNRLPIADINKILLSVKSDPRPLRALRDYALICFGADSALRCESIMDVTLNDIQQSSDGYWIVTAIGKGGKVYTPAIEPTTKAAIDAWVSAYNADLPPDDPRYIRPDTRIWQPLTKSGNRRATGRAEDGINDYSIYNIVTNRAKAAGFDLHPHDLRRTCAFNLVMAGAPLEAIQQKLGHEDISTTMVYIGKQQNNTAQSLATYGLVFA